MKILITGIQGCLGSSFVTILREDHQIFGLDFDAEEMDGVEQMYTYNHLKDIPDVDVVMHLAGKSQDTLDTSKALEYFEYNAGLTRKVYGWFLESDAKAFIYFSSVKAAADDSYYGKPITEEVTPKPFGPFGESKLLAESYVLSQWPKGKLVYVLRPVIIHGCGMIGNLNMEMLYRWAKSGLPYVFGKFECRRSYTTMDNLAFVLKRLLDLDIPAGIYNVVDDDTLTTNETYELFCMALGKKVRKMYWDKWFLHLIAKMGTLFHWKFNEYQYLKLSSNFFVSNEKLKQALGISSMPVSTVDGLLKSVACFKKKQERSKICN
jgi:nucleoside-diphosphate-sugar epimerase